MDKIDTDALDKDQCTPLCLAIRQENYVAAETLIKNGADVNKGGGIFGSPLHLSIVRLNYTIVDALINEGADLNIKDQYGNSPIHLIMNIFCYLISFFCHRSKNKTVNLKSVEKFIFIRFLYRDEILPSRVTHV